MLASCFTIAVLDVDFAATPLATCCSPSSRVRIIVSIISPAAVLGGGSGGGGSDRHDGCLMPQVCHVYVYIYI